MPFDVVLATSMLQVGVDVPRLGLMLVVGQPKNTAEYIQASSRVGREASKPGLVVTLANRSRPRDMAHYEQFEHYHDTFYAHVEALSVTPFSDAALERGLTGVTGVGGARADQRNEPLALARRTGLGRSLQRRPFVDTLVDRLVTRIRLRAAGMTRWRTLPKASSFCASTSGRTSRTSGRALDVSEGLSGRRADRVTPAGEPGDVDRR